jgi:hypothetical protein
LSNKEGGNVRKMWIGLSLLLVLVFSCLTWAGQPLETETARLIAPGKANIECAFEFQTSSDGKEYAAPIAIEYGLANRFELLVEPVFYTAIRPKLGPRATGVGDLECTLEYLALNENGRLPAIALAAEFKLPTTKNNLIGTGKTDFTGYMILSKHYGQFDTHGNLGYCIMEKPAGISLNNIIVFAMAEEYHLNSQIDIVGEFLGNTSSEATGGVFLGNESATAPEVAGGELVGMIGGRYSIQRNIVLSLGSCYDNNQALLLRPGLTIGF